MYLLEIVNSSCSDWRLVAVTT